MVTGNGVSTFASPPPPPTRLMVLKGMKLLAVVVFMGWLLIWIMMPTTTYMNVWYPKLRSATDSTYIGRQGMVMLIFTFPILFISVVGCMYLHMMKKNDEVQAGKSSSHLDAWKKPLIVKGPLGIVSALELAFCLMFIVLLVWYLTMYIITGFAHITEESAEEFGHKVWQEKLERVALRFGLVGNLCCAFLFFPVTRGSSLLPIVGLSSEASIKYHVWLGHIVMVLFTAHGACYITYWISINNISQMLEWDTHVISNLAGEIALFSGLLMWVTTFPRIRRRMFELFFYTHQLYIVFLVFYLLHLGITFCSTVLPGIYLFMIDRYLRFLQSRRRVRLISARLLPSEAVELNFSKCQGFSYTPLSTMFINVPCISTLQWHPYTISSSSNFDPDELSVVIKKEGTWTQKLYQKLNQPSLDHLYVSVEGPYGPPSVNFLRHDSLVMVSGGSGITPFTSIIRELAYRSTNLNIPIPSVLLICCFKTSSDLTMLDLLLPISTNTANLSTLNLKVEAFVTREKFPPTSNSHKLIRTIWFKPNQSDSPIGPILGRNGWLWLGMIISSSFIAFLVLVGILTRYYIYPMENVGKKFSITSTALLNLLFICASIAAASSVAVLWNKKKCSSLEGKQAKLNADDISSREFCNGDRELESMPHQSLEKVTTLHFGRRPYLKKMLSGIEGLSIGVMASGPSGLRHDVAAICSACQATANNLHFESISFNW